MRFLEHSPAVALAVLPLVAAGHGLPGCRAPASAAVPSAELFEGYGTEPAPPGWMSAGSLQATIHYDTPGQTLSIDWTNGGADTTFELALGYYPTQVASLGLETCLVAGRDARGRTILERMVVSPPRQQIDPTGEPHLVGAALLGRERLYEERATGRDCIRFLLPRLDAPSHVLLWFWDSRDLYDLDLASKRYELVASPRAQAGVLHVPELRGRRSEWFAAEHADYGYVYGFAALSSGVSPLVLMDRDEDGRLDSYLATTPSTWDSLGFADPEKYLR